MIKFRIALLFVFVILLVGCDHNDCGKYDSSYVPANLEDTFLFFECTWSPEQIKKFKNLHESEVTYYFDDYGRNLRNSWGFWKGEGRLFKSLKDIGLLHPDDMSSVILISFHRRLNGKNLLLEEKIAYYKKYWEKAAVERRVRYLEKLDRFTLNDTIYLTNVSGVVNQEERTNRRENNCIPKAILLAKRESDFYLKIRVIEECDEKGMYVIDPNEDGRRIINEGDVDWVFVRNWKPKL